MITLNRPVSGNKKTKGLVYEGIAGKNISQNEMCQITCDVGHMSTTDNGIMIGNVNSQFPLWCKLSESRVLLLNFIQNGLTVEIYGKVMKVNEDETTRATKPFLHATGDDEVLLVDNAFFSGVDSIAICKLSNKDREICIFKSKRTFFGVEIKGVGNQIELLFVNDINEDVSLYYGELFSNYTDNQFIYFDFDEDTATLNVYKYELFKDNNGVNLLFSGSLTGLTGYKLLKVAQLDDNDYYAILTNVVNSQTKIYFYQIRVDTAVKTWLVDEFTLSKEFNTLSCDYRNGYVTILCGYNNISMRTYIYFISSKENIVELYHKNRKITQANVFNGVQGVMVLNNGLAYVTYSSSLTNQTSLVIMDNPNQPSFAATTLMNKPVFYKVNQPIICQNNVYFIYTYSLGNTMNIACFAYFLKPAFIPFYPYNKQFGVCQKSAKYYQPTSLIYPKP